MPDHKTNEGEEQPRDVISNLPGGRTWADVKSIEIKPAMVEGDLCLRWRVEFSDGEVETGHGPIFVQKQILDRLPASPIQRKPL